MPKEMEYEELVVGEELGVREVVPSVDLNVRFLNATEDDNPWYWVDSPFGGPIVHHSAIDGYTMAMAGERHPWPPGFVHSKQVTEFINPARVGKKLIVRARIADKFIKRGRGYVAIEETVQEEGGLEIMRIRMEGMIDDERIREAKRRRGG